MLGVRHRLAVDVHRRLNAGVPNQFLLNSKRSASTVDPDQ